MNHSKSGPFEIRTKIDHSKSRHVRISDPHCKLKFWIHLADLWLSRFYNSTQPSVFKYSEDLNNGPLNNETIEILEVWTIQIADFWSVIQVMDLTEDNLTQLLTVQQKKLLD